MARKKTILKCVAHVYDSPKRAWIMSEKLMARVIGKSLDFEQGKVALISDLSNSTVSVLCYEGCDKELMEKLTGIFEHGRSF